MHTVGSVTAEYGGPELESVDVNFEIADIHHADLYLKIYCFEAKTALKLPARN